MEGIKDPYLFLFPSVLGRVLNNLTFIERCTILSARSEQWRKLCLFKSKKISLIRDDVLTFCRKLDISERNVNKEKVILEHVLNIPYSTDNLNSLYIDSSMLKLYVKLYKVNNNHDFQGIKTLQYWRLDSKGEDLKSLYDIFPNMESLHMRGTPGSKSRCIIRSLKMCNYELCELCLTHAYIGKESLGTLFTKCLKLKVLKLINLPKCIDIIIPEHMQLHDLYIDGVNVDSLDIRTQKSLQRFTFYPFRNGDEYDSVLSQILGSIHTLEYLAFTSLNVTQVTGFLRQFSKLRTLCYNIALMDVSELKLLAEIACCNELRSLRLAIESEYVSDHSGIYDLVNGLPNLMYFNYFCYGSLPLQEDRFLARKKSLHIVDCQKRQILIKSSTT